MPLDGVSNFANTRARRWWRSGLGPSASSPGTAGHGLADRGDGTGGRNLRDLARIQLEVRILEVMPNREAAQALRWQTFTHDLISAVKLGVSIRQSAEGMPR
jgi:hypothetical protein